MHQQESAVTIDVSNTFTQDLLLIDDIPNSFTYQFLQTLLDKNMKFKFTCINNEKIQQFETISNFYYSLSFVNIGKITVYLNKTDGELLHLPEDVYIAFVKFENNQDEYINFKSYIEQVSVKEKNNEQDNNDQIKKIISICESEKKQMIKQIRYISMNWITTMSSNEFQERILYGKKPEFKLPDFQRATEEDEDYPKLTRQTNHYYPKKKLSDKEIDLNIYNYAYVNRHLLRVMSEEEFKNDCYEDLNVVSVSSKYTDFTFA